MSSRVPESVPPGKIRLTVEDYMVLPDDGKRYQILDGELDVTPAPTTAHQTISKRLQRLLLHYAEGLGLGEVYYAPVDVVLDSSTVVQPDLIYISKEKSRILTDLNVQGPPDLVVEILSESSARTDRVVKARLYARFGVDHYWIVDPEARSVEEYVREGDGYRLVGKRAEKLRPTLFPGLEIEVKELFRPPFSG